VGSFRRGALAGERRPRRRGDAKGNAKGVWWAGFAGLPRRDTRAHEGGPWVRLAEMNGGETTGDTDKHRRNATKCAHPCRGARSAFKWWSLLELKMEWSKKRVAEGSGWGPEEAVTGERVKRERRADRARAVAGGKETVAAMVAPPVAERGDGRCAGTPAYYARRMSLFA
jgi:hypothetical protein